MKNILILLLMLTPALLIGQDFTNQRLVRFLELTESEVAELTDLQFQRNRIVEEAQLEQNLIKAQLEKLLFPPDADLRAIERKMEESLTWRLKVEMANITLRVEARKLLGEERWRKFLQAQREMRSRDGDNRVDSENRRGD